METRTRNTLSFFIKKARLLKNGEASINMKLTINKECLHITIGKNVKPEIWEAFQGKKKITTREGLEIKDYLDHTRHVIKQHISNLREEDKEITVHSVRDAYLGIKDNQKTIIGIFQEHNDKATLLKGKDFAPATVQRYESCLRLTQAYIKEKYNRNDLPLDKIDHSFITGLEMFYKTKRNCSHNTTIKYLKNLKKITNLALANGWMKKNPYANFKFTLRKVDKGFLTEEELDIIIKKEYDIERMQNVKDCFVFGCFTGLAYSDLKSLTMENIVKGDDGRLWINTRRHKTDNQCNIPLLPIALELIDKYSEHPICKEKHQLLPIPTNQKLNMYLKEMADSCGIKKEITTHMARHTFATTVTLNNDIPIESVSKMLGHSSINMTRIYARLLDKKVSQDMSKLYQKYTVK
jgi:site-specific recombinase XerD